MSVVRSKAVILTSFIHCSVVATLCVGVLLCVLSNLAISDTVQESPGCINLIWFRLNVFCVSS